MAETKVLKAQARDGVGKGAAREMRRQGLVPAVIYGDKKPPVTIALAYKDAYKHIYAGGFLSHIIELDVDGTKHRVIPRDYQLDPVKDFPLHVDFLRIGKGSKINVQVHVNFINEEASPGLKRGGTLNIVHHTLDLTVAADNIPEEVTVDLTGLDIGDTIHISNVKLPAGAVDHSHEEDVTIATIVAPSALKSAGTEDEAAAEGEAEAE
ncbi:50S ribosomal protein L25/general stress protein Ctc [Devosia naphthalenivorans]|jgi:large subunit ribosomal protein L25|uniref:50S ribosomal protein L25/general stress protein Ctc n=1 Tax=Devosia naphthalenivorans TaxID=2082392 RepID=UPI000D3703A3|nr:50S ribosomal protein L25/general stress protein Ctc [Devosia naphthalenivorans]